MARPTSQRRLALLLITLAVLLAVVAFSSQHPIGAHVRGVSRGTLRTATWTVILILGLLVAFGAAVLAGSLQPHLRKRSPEEERTPPLPLHPAWLVAPLVMALGLVAAVVIIALHSKRHSPRPPVNIGSGGSGLGLLHGKQAPTVGPPTALLVALAAVVLVLGAVWVAYVVRSRRGRRGVAAPTPARALSTAIDESLATLDSESDPRRAVILAYLHMERALAAHNLAREVYEAPREYAARMQPALGEGAAAAGELTELFEEARFSTHAIGEPLRARAAAALRTLRGWPDARPLTGARA